MTIATFAAPSESARVNSRPAISGMPIVRKWPAATLVKRALLSMSGPDWKPCTRTSVPQLEPAITGTVDAVTRRHARLRRQRVFEPLEQHLRAFGRIGVQLRRNAERGEVIGLQPEVDARHVEQALR